MKRLLTLTLVLGCAYGQHQHENAKSSRTSLLPGLGRHHHPIATSSVEAQKFFDEGLTLIYAFNHDEAIRSFERASALDPAAAMPYWGIAVALGPNINMDVDPAGEKKAYEAAQKALTMRERAPESERAYIDALGKRYSIDPKADLKKLAVEYKDAMGELARRYPDDLDAATLYAESMMDLRPWQLWTADGKPAEGTAEIVAVLESVLKRDPQHVGANHYYIHTVEASPNPERALPSAGRLAGRVPQAGHLVHMPAHIYIQTGDYEAAAKANEQAAEVDRNYIKKTGATGVYPLMYYSHNLHFLVAARAAQGRFEEARKAAAQLVANVSSAVKDMPMLEGFLPTPLFVLLRFHRWGEILKLPAPDAKLAASTAVWHYARGCAFAATGDARNAASEQAALAGIRKQTPADAMFGPLNTAESIFKVADAVLSARIAAAGGDAAGAIEHWKRAVSAQDALAYDEPPAWYYPVRESLGAALLANGRGAEAEAVFREDLKRNARNGRSLFGLMESLKAQKKTT